MMLIRAYLGLFKTIQDILGGNVRIPGMEGLVCFRSSLWIDGVTVLRTSKVGRVIGFLLFSSGLQAIQSA
jgi:hypothetical protein